MIESLRHAVRALRRDPILWLTATLTLALCIGANTTVFSLVNSILLRPLPFPAADRIYWVSERTGKTLAEIGIGADYYSLREAHCMFGEVGAFDPLTLNWSGRDKLEQLARGANRPTGASAADGGVRPTIYADATQTSKVSGIARSWLRPVVVRAALGWTSRRLIPLGLREGRGAEGAVPQ